jgi:dTDP-4-dehydrorhamnose reductase
VSRYLIIGKSGQLGTAYRQILPAESVVAVDQDEVDLSRPQDIQLKLSGIGVVLNCAAYTAVDAAETDEDTARRVNADAVGVIAQQCRDAGVPLVHFSTDYVFQGHATAPYPVDAPRGALGAYGRTKQLGEELLEQSGVSYLLVRTSWVYAPWGNNFVRTMARLMFQKDELKVVHDQRGRPTHATGLAERALRLFDLGQRGTFHVTDEGECSWYEFALSIRDTIGASCAIQPCTSAAFPRPAPRPPYSVLDLSKTTAVLGPGRSYQTWLADMREELLTDVTRVD